MLISAQEFSRGVVRWSLDRHALIYAQSLLADGSTEVSREMEDASGTVVSVEQPGIMCFQIHPTDGALLDVSGSLTYVRDLGGEIVSFVYDVGNGAISGLPPQIGIPGRGHFERVVATAPSIRIPPRSTVIHVNNAVIHLLPRTTLMRNCVEEEIQESGDSFRIISSPRETLVTGPLIEIVAPTSIHGLPSTPLAILALSVLELAKWGNAEVIQVDSIQSGQFGALHGVTLWPQPPILGPANRQIVIPTTISEDQLKALDCHLACIMESQPIAEKLFIPLRWYLRARGSSDDLDTFASAFIGLEGLISAHSQEAGTVSRIQKLANDPQVAELLGSLRGEYPDAHVDQLVRRLSHVGPSLLDHVEAITASLSLSPEATNQFRRAQKQRGAVLHGSKDQITPEWATWAIDTLGEVIRAVLIDSGCSC